MEATKVWRWSNNPRRLYSLLRRAIRRSPSNEGAVSSEEPIAGQTGLTAPSQNGIQSRDIPDLDRSLPALVAAYIHDLDTVPGWLSRLDVLVLVELDRLQAGHGFSGDLFEIGTYCGKTAILLRYLAKDGERLTVCDVFGEDLPVSNTNAEENARWYNFSQADFDHHFRRFHKELPEIIIKPSIEIDTSDRLHTCRIVHIDGSHVHAIVKHDIATARNLMAPGGIVVMDDISTSHNPGSALATWEAVLNGTLFPVCLTDAKLYGVFERPQIPLAEALESWANGRSDVATEWHELAGHRVLRVMPSASD